MRLFKKLKKSKKEKSTGNNEEKKKKQSSCCDFQIEEVVETHFNSKTTKK